MVHVYDISGRRILKARDLSEAATRLVKWAGYLSTWDDRSGECFERKGGVWQAMPSRAERGTA